MKNIVISGGGLNSLYILGVIKYLDEKKLINGLENFSGTSGGSIICLLLLLGYRFNELYKLCKSYKMSNILEMDILNVMSNYSLYGNDKIKKILNIFIKNKYNIINPTFKKLFDLTQKKLFVIATDVECGSEKIFSVDNTPNICICDAICASSAIPFIFPYNEIDNCKYVDGVFINNYPINIFKDDLENTIGINIRSHKLKNRKVDNLASYAINLYDLILNSLGSNTINELKAKMEIEISKKQLNINTYIDNIDNIIDEIYEDTKKNMREN